MRQEFLTMRLVVLLGAAATAQSPALQVGSHTVADAPSLSLSAPSLRALALRVQLPGTRPGELKALPLLEGRNATGVPMIFNSSHSVYSVLVPSIPSNNSGDDRAIKGVRLYAEHTLSGGAGGKTDGSPEVRVIAHNKPGDGPEGFDEHDQREHLEDPYCGVVEGPCVGHDTQLGGFYMPLNHEQGKKTRFQLVACPADDGEETCEKQGHTYTLWVFFPDWDPSTQPDADLSWGWVAGCVLCEISAFLYACGICLQRYGLSLQVEEEKTKRQSIMGISGSEMPLSVASHIVTAPPGSVAGQMVSVSVNGRMVRVEVPVGVGPGDQFSVPLVDGGGGLGDAGASGAAVGGGCKGWCRESLCTKPNLIWVFGMMMWFIGNSLYTFALNYAPLSLLTSLFATVLVFNGALAWFFLQEQVRPSDVTGCFLIFIGITICGIYIDKTVIQFSAHEIVLLAEKPVALVYEVFVLSFIVGITSVVLMYSRNNPGSRGPYPMYMRFAYLPRYPCVIAMYECLIQICLKGLSNMLAMTYEFFTSGGVSGNNQADSPIFWGIFLLCGMCSFAVMVWMRAGYARFEAVQMLPIQMATLTTFTVIGGLMFYNEYTRMSWPDLLMTGLGVAFICGGIFVMDTYRENGIPSPREIVNGRARRSRSGSGGGLPESLLGGQRQSVGDWDIETTGVGKAPGSLAGAL